MAISAILVAAAIPQFTNFSASKVTRTQTAALSSDIRLARSEAIKRSRNVTLCRSDAPEAEAPACSQGAGDWTSGWIVFEDRGNRGAVDSNDTIIKVQPATRNRGSIVTAAGGFWLITFRNTGMPVTGAPPPNTTLLVLPPLPEAERQNSPLRKSIIVDFAGRIRVI